VDRWSVADSVFYWLTTFPFRLASLVVPLLYWFCNVTVVNASVPDVLSYFGTYIVWVLIALNFLTRGIVVPVVNDVSQILGAIPITRAAVVGLFRPKGHPFSVTAKGGDRSKTTVQWRLMAPFALLLLLSLAGLALGLVSDRFAYYDAGDGKAVVLFWTFYNLVVLTVAVLACVELPRQERHVADRPVRVSFTSEGSAPERVWLASLTQDGARIRGQVFGQGLQGVLTVPELGDIAATVVGTTKDGARLRLAPSSEVHAALILRFYTQGGAPGVIRLRLANLVRDAATRLSFDKRVR
jgi:cellulose synthase (UDP-forming)